jgi:hypothetical protein
MRKQSNIRVVLSEAQTHEVHQMSLRENRSQSNALSILIGEALAARRSATTEVSRLVRSIRGQADFNPDQGA